MLAAAGLLLNPWFVRILTVDGDLSASAVRRIILAIDAPLVAAGTYFIATRRRPRAHTWPITLAQVAAIVAVDLFILAVVAFAILEVVPQRFTGLLERTHPYYGTRTRFAFDPELAYRNRPLLVSDTLQNGELFHPKSRVERDPFAMRIARDADGFNNREARTAADVVVLGDSWVYYGVDANDTFGARLEQASGLATYSAAVSGYSPPQYLILFRRHGRMRRPRVALLCFYEGNDMPETKQFLQWRATGATTGFQGYVVRVTSGHVFQRFGMAVVGSVLRLSGAAEDA